MTDLGKFGPGKIMARLGELVDERIKVHHESPDFALLQVTRTSEGIDLWERARKMRLADTLPSPPRGLAYTPAALAQLCEKFDRMVLAEQQAHPHSEHSATLAVIRTKEGTELWEDIRNIRRGVIFKE